MSLEELILRAGAESVAEPLAISARAALRESYDTIPREAFRWSRRLDAGSRVPGVRGTLRGGRPDHRADSEERVHGVICAARRAAVRKRRYTPSPMHFDIRPDPAMEVAGRAST